MLCIEGAAPCIGKSRARHARRFLRCLGLDIKLQRLLFKRRDFNRKRVGALNEFRVFRAQCEEATSRRISTRRGIGNHAAAFINQRTSARGNAATRECAMRQFNGTLNGVNDKSA